MPRSSIFSDGVSLAKRSAACASVMRPRLALADSVSLMRSTPRSSASCVVSTMVTGKPRVEEGEADAGAHGAGAEDADRLDVAQLGVGADAGQVGGLALGEERVLQGPRVGAGRRLAEQLALARIAFAERQVGCRLHRVDGGLGRDRPARMSGDGGARLLEQPGRYGGLVDLLLADAARRLADLLLGEGDCRRHHVAVGNLVDQAGGCAPWRRR